VRLDKFLKCIRIIKRRTIANEICDLGLVTINGKPAKASAEVREGDVIEGRIVNRRFTCRVLKVPTHEPPKDTVGEFAEVETSVIRGEAGEVS